jgi:hypothetical protein
MDGKSCNNCFHDCKIDKTGKWRCGAWKPQMKVCPFLGKNGVCKVCEKAESTLILCKDIESCSMRLSLRTGSTR